MTTSLRSRLVTTRPHFRTGRISSNGTPRICWLSDIHLTHLRSREMSRVFGTYLRQEQDFDCVVITGDIAQADNLAQLLRLFAEGVGKDIQVYYTLGNHDYYGSSIEAVHASLQKPLAPNLVWLDDEPPILLDDHVALVGKYGWYDAMHGDAERSDVILSDFTYVADFKQLFNESAWTYQPNGRTPLLNRLRFLARRAARDAESTMYAASKLRKRIIFATHIPPFPQACWHEGRLSNERWMPWFTCDAMGKMLERFAQDHPEHQILVLCGHTHSKGVHQHASNLRVLTAKALYGAPDVAGIFVDPFDWISRPAAAAHE